MAAARVLVFTAGVSSQRLRNGALGIGLRGWLPGNAGMLAYTGARVQDPVIASRLHSGYGLFPSGKSRNPEL
jgi:hypothetical protein